MQCSAFARSEHLDPIGTAGSYRAFLLVEWPLPWPPDFGADPQLCVLRPALSAAGARLQGLVASPESAVRRVILYSHSGEHPFAGYRRTERVAAPREVVTAAEDLLDAFVSGSTLPLDLPDVAGGANRDVLVCTHGRRDRCCGSRGTKLAAELMAEPGTLGDGIRVWRTSHTGGHRFAPTAIVLPEGTAWGYLDAGILRAVVARDRLPGEFLAHYRGCAGLSSAPLQAVERAVMAEVGWAMLDRPRHGHQAPDGCVRLTIEGAADGLGGWPNDPTTWEARVDIARQVPIAECGAPTERSPKSQPELVVRELHRIS